MQQVLDRIGRLVLAQQNGRLVRMENERLLARDFLSCAMERIYARVILCAAFPAVLNSKVKLRNCRRCLDRIDGCQKIVNIDAVDDGWNLLCGYHICIPQFD